MPLAFVCDFCGLAIHKEGFALDMFDARAVPSEEGVPRLVEQRRLRSYYTCPACAKRVEAVISALEAEGRTRQAS